MVQVEFRVHPFEFDSRRQFRVHSEKTVFGLFFLRLAKHIVMQHASNLVEDQIVCQNREGGLLSHKTEQEWYVAFFEVHCVSVDLQQMGGVGYLLLLGGCEL